MIDLLTVALLSFQPSCIKQNSGDRSQEHHVNILYLSHFIVRYYLQTDAERPLLDTCKNLSVTENSPQQENQREKLSSSVHLDLHFTLWVSNVCVTLTAVPRNYDPVLHPFEVPREYTRALNATKLERVFAKPFLSSLDGHRDGVNCMAKHPKSLSTVLSGACDGEVSCSFKPQ